MINKVDIPVYKTTFVVHCGPADELNDYIKSLRLDEKEQNHILASFTRRGIADAVNIDGLCWIISVDQAPDNAHLVGVISALAYQYVCNVMASLKIEHNKHTVNVYANLLNFVVTQIYMTILKSEPYEKMR